MRAGKKLFDLKEGDEAIFVRHRESGEERSVAIISKVKGNRIHCGAARFDRETGLPVGSWLGDPSVRCHLKAATKREIEDVLQEHDPKMVHKREADLGGRIARDILARALDDVSQRLRQLTTAARHELARVFEVEL